MAFPTTGLLENFTGADASLLDADWTTMSGANPPRITSNQGGNASASGAYVGAVYDTATFGPDCECYMTVPVVADYVGVYARMPSLASTDGYQASWAGSALTLQRNSGGGQVQIGSATVAQSNGEKLGIECIGSTIKVYTDTGGGWVERISATNSDYTAAGYIAFDLYDVSALTRVDDFSGGTAVTSSWSPNPIPAPAGMFDPLLNPNAWW
jgi:hypothetical protein